MDEGAARLPDYNELLDIVRVGDFFVSWWHMTEFLCREVRRHRKWWQISREKLFDTLVASTLGWNEMSLTDSSSFVS
jgi:hypothetical protein